MLCARKTALESCLLDECRVRDGRLEVEALKLPFVRFATRKQEVGIEGGVKVKVSQTRQVAAAQLRPRRDSLASTLKQRNWRGVESNVGSNRLEQSVGRSGVAQQQGGETVDKNKSREMRYFNYKAKCTLFAQNVRCLHLGWAIGVNPPGGCQ